MEPRTSPSLQRVLFSSSVTSTTFKNEFVLSPPFNSGQIASYLCSLSRPVLFFCLFVSRSSWLSVFAAFVLAALLLHDRDAGFPLIPSARRLPDVHRAPRGGRPSWRRLGRRAGPSRDAKLIDLIGRRPAGPGAGAPLLPSPRGTNAIGSRESLPRDAGVVDDLSSVSPF